MNEPQQRVHLKEYDIRRFCGEVVRERRGEIVAKQTTDIKMRIDRLYALLAKGQSDSFLQTHQLDPIMSREEDAKSPPSSGARSGRRKSLLTRFKSAWPDSLNKQGHGYMLDKATREKMLPTPEEMVEAVRRAMAAVAPGLNPTYFDIPLEVPMFGESVQIDLDLLQEKGATQRIVEKRSDAIAVAVQEDVPAEVVMDFEALAAYYDASILVAEEQAAALLVHAQKLRALRDALPVGPTKIRLPKSEAPAEVPAKNKDMSSLFPEPPDLEAQKADIEAAQNGFRNATGDEQQAYLTALIKELNRLAPVRTVRVMQFILLRPSQEDPIMPAEFNPHVVEPGTDCETVEMRKMQGARKAVFTSVKNSFPELLEKIGAKRGTKYLVNEKILAQIYLGFVTWAAQNEIEINTKAQAEEAEAEENDPTEVEKPPAATIEEVCNHMGFQAPRGRAKRVLRLLLEAYPEPLDASQNLQDRLGAQDLMGDMNWGLYIFAAGGGANRFGIASNIIPS